MLVLIIGKKCLSILIILQVHPCVRILDNIVWNDKNDLNQKHPEISQKTLWQS